MTNQPKKIMHILKSTLYYTVIGLLLFIIAVSLFVPSGLIKVMGFGWYRVVSNSMEPLIMIDDYIIAVRKDNPSELEDGDIIVFETYFFHNGAYSKDVVTHHFGGFTEEGYILTYPHSQVDEDDKVYDIWRKGPGDIYHVTVDDLLGVHVMTLPTSGFVSFTTFLFTTPMGIGIVVINIGIVVAIIYLFRSEKKPEIVGEEEDDDLGKTD